VEKITHDFGLLLQFSTNLPKEKIAQKGEKFAQSWSPPPQASLVVNTLKYGHTCTEFKSQEKINNGRK
jgi:hypothetical protein